jgi:hypothetical protein
MLLIELPRDAPQDFIGLLAAPRVAFIVLAPFHPAPTLPATRRKSRLAVRVFELPVKLLMKVSLKINGFPVLGSAHVLRVYMVAVDCLGRSLCRWAFCDALSNGRFSLGA